MAGLGEVEELSADYSSPPVNVVVWQEGKWAPLIPLGQTFGPELAFGRAIGAALPAERIGIVKLAVGGTPIDRWSPADPGSLYAELLQRLRAAQGAAPGAQVGAVLWM
jgi:hypothetical protein